MEAVAQIKRLMLPELQTRLEYQALIPTHKIFVDVLLLKGYATGSFDFLGACLAAYPRAGASPQMLAIRSSQVQSHPRVSRVLDLAFGRVTEKTDPVMEDLRKAIKRSIKRDCGVIGENTLTAIKFYEAQSGKTLGKTHAK
jgi:hypothetical protein